MADKIKICLICHFSNPLVRAHIAWPINAQPMGDFAAWNTEYIQALAARTDIELHVIMPMMHMRHLSQGFEEGGVHYYCYKPDILFLNKGWPRYFPLDRLSNYYWSRKLVKHWVEQINPDIVHLMGAENPYYAATILDIKDFPIFLTIQGIYSNPERFKIIKEDRYRSWLERKIHSICHYIGVAASFMPALIKRDNDNAVLFWNRVPIARPKQFLTPKEKCFDFVQFCRLTRSKGVEDTIRATARVVRRFPSVKVRIVGRVDASFLCEMETLIVKLGLRENVFISGGYERHEDLFAEVSKAKAYILPTHIEAFASTILEATYMGMPVISYKTGDIPMLNIGDERVLLSDIGDIDDLSANMMRILSDSDFGQELNKKAKAFIDTYFSNEFNVNQFVDIYRAIIDNYHSGAKIPVSLLYEGFLERKMGLL